MSIRSLARQAILALTCLGVAVPAATQDYPSKTIRLVVPQNPGGITDVIARMLGEHFSAAFKTPAIVENKPGGNSVIGSAFVARAVPDGHTLLIALPSVAIFNVLLKEPEIDGLKDLAPISQLIAVPSLIAINASLPVNTLSEFIAFAKANPGKINYGAAGGNQMLTVEYLARVAGINLVRINYVGEAKAAPALASNEVQMTIASPASLAPMVQAGKVKVLATTSASLRNPSMPEIPTATESGLRNYDVIGWFGLLGPANTPPSIQRRLAGEVASWARRPDVIERVHKFGSVPQSSTPEEFANLIATDNRRWTEIAKLVGLEKQ